MAAPAQLQYACWCILTHPSLKNTTCLFIFSENLQRATDDSNRVLSKVAPESALNVCAWISTENTRISTAETQRAQKGAKQRPHASWVSGTEDEQSSCLQVCLTSPNTRKIKRKENTYTILVGKSRPRSKAWHVKVMRAPLGTVLCLHTVSYLHWVTNLYTKKQILSGVQIIRKNKLPP